MTTLAELHRAVRTAIASKRLGRPVFVRYHLQGVLEGEEELMGALAHVAATVGDWIGEQPNKVTALAYSRQPKAQCSLLLQFPGGATAFVSECHWTLAPRGIELAVVGNKGALYHAYDGGSLQLWEDVTTSLPEGRGAEILAAIDESRTNVGSPAVVKPAPALPAPESIGPPDEIAPRYGVLLVSGSHTHQENYAAAFAADRRARLVAVTDEPGIDKRRRELNERLADTLGLPYIPDLGKALERKDVHIVSICAPPDRRGRIAVRCAEAGKHLYLDKPLAPKLAEADAIAAAVRKAGVNSHMFSMITQPWARAAKRLIEGGTLGKLLAIHADAFFAKGPAGTAKLGTPRKEEYPPERQQLVEAKRELDNIGVYPIAMIRWLTGKKFRTVYGVTGNYFFQEHQKHNVEDFGVLACTLDDGLPVTISAGRVGWQAHPAGGVNRIILMGTERTVIVDANRPRLEVGADEKPWVPPNVNPADPMGFWSSTQDEVHLQPKRAWLPVTPPGRSDASYFLDCLDARRDSELTAADAALTTEVLLAAYKSAATGEVVTLPLPR